MYIQYEGFNVTTGSRTYNFRVLNTLQEARHFTIKIQSKAFCEAALKLQDGPAICFGHLKHELESETEESPAEANLSIGEQDIREYVERHYPRLALAAKRSFLR